MKKCFKCKEEKPLSEFYKHSGMTDGRLNKCKSCTKLDVKKNYVKNIDKIKEYERSRANLEHRVLARKEYSKTDAYKKSHAKSIVKYKEKNPKRYYAAKAVRNSIKNKSLTKLPCFVCGNTNVHGHHPNYDAPLDVIWLCTKHHAEIHLEARRMK